MNPVLEKVVLTIVGVLVSGLLAWLGAQIAKYKKLTKQAEDETVKQTIVNTLTTTLEPLKNDINDLKVDIGDLKSDVGTLKTDIVNMKQDISKLQTSEVNFTTRLNPMQDEIEHLKDDITEILNNLKCQGIELHNIREKEELLAHETRCAWRYRIRQLCHAYVARGYMSFEEYSQLQEMFNIYVAIGGNGQTKELYERTMNSIEIKTDVEIAALKAMTNENK